MDSVWIDLRKRDHEVVIQEHRDVYAPFQDVYFPCHQGPQMMMFIGGHSKTVSMNSLFLTKGQQSHYQVHLRLIPVMDESPTFIADCELHNILSFKDASGSDISGTMLERPVRWLESIAKGDDRQIIANLIYAKLIAPFCTVICFFANDLGGMMGTANLLASWLISLKEVSPELPKSTYPLVVILRSWDDPISSFDEQLAAIGFKEDLRQEMDTLQNKFGRNDHKLTDAEFNSMIEKQFNDIRVLALPTLQSDAHYEKGIELKFKSIQMRLLRESRDMQHRRRTAMVAFSAVHFHAFLSSALDHFSKDISPFNFVEASRLPNPVPQRFGAHVIRFLKHNSRKSQLALAVPVIASALCLDSYPPEMHGKSKMLVCQPRSKERLVFHPTQVIDKLYRHIFSEIESELRDPDISREILREIKELYCEQVLVNLDQRTQAAASHKAVLSRFPDWKKILDYTSCLACIAREPENTLSCKHCLCDPCIFIHGKKTRDEPWTFTLSKCPLCQYPNQIVFDLKPYTAGVRGLIIDGGSIQSIRCLKVLEDELNLSMPIQDCFDIATGSDFGM
jgi:hypothetical protein